MASSAKGALPSCDDPAVLIEQLTANFPDAMLQAVDDDRLIDRVIALIANPAMDVNLPLDIRGTPFQRRVWAA